MGTSVLHRETLQDLDGGRRALSGDLASTVLLASAGSSGPGRVRCWLEQKPQATAGRTWDTHPAGVDGGTAGVAVEPAVPLTPQIPPWGRGQPGLQRCFLNFS